MPFTIECEHCHRKVEKRHRGTRFCTNRCGQLAQLQMRNIICRWCGLFAAVPTMPSLPDPAYCSDACRESAYADRLSLRPKSATCKECGLEMRSKWKEQFCSPECAALSRRQRRRVLITCAHCGREKELDKTSRALKLGHGRFCSIACGSLHRDTVGSMREASAKLRASFAEASGWPVQLTPRQVQILNLLASLGECSTRAMAEKIGSRSPLDFVRPLLASGYVARIHRGRNQFGYLLGPKALAHLEASAHGNVEN